MLFKVSNHQCKDSGSPPEIDGDRLGAMHSYYENEHGEQAVFEGDLNTGEILVRMGDCDWEQRLTLQPIPLRLVDESGSIPLRLVDESGSTIMPEAGEKLWLQACWQSMRYVRARLQRESEEQA